jgi:hypothetical protein
MTVRFFAKCFLGAALLMPMHFANAQGAGQSPAAAVSAFLANPSQALAQFPSGGPGLAKQVSELLALDKNTLPSIMALLKTATPDQQAAIADGLGQTAKAAAKNDPAFANQIQQAVAASGIPAVLKQYAAIAGDTGTAATGGGGGGGGGPTTPGATGGGANGGAINNPNNFAANNSANLLTGATLGGSFFDNNTTNTVTNNSVSPQ